MVLKKLRASLGGALDIPQDVLHDVPKITIVGNKQVWIENHTGILEYGPEVVRLDSKLGQIRICGSEMVLVELLPSEVKLEGCLKSFGFGGE